MESNARPKPFVWPFDLTIQSLLYFRRYHGPEVQVAHRAAPPQDARPCWPGRPSHRSGTCQVILDLPVTARGDLDALASMGTVVRSHGGAVSRLAPAQDYPLRTKEALHHEEKVRIGRAAAEFIRSGETIILDSGTTTVEIARHLKILKTPSITVITNALNIAVELTDTPGISLIMVGGLLRPLSCSFVGPQAEVMMNEFHADRLFLAVDGFDLDAGPSTPDVLEAQLNNVMMRSAREVTVVADFSKLGRRAISRIGPFERIHRLITDKRAPAQFTDALRQKGIEVIEV
jgi:DeoR family transcriptional regulator of aga operon